MSATQTQPPGADPSMEDILASIRRILSEEDAPDQAPAAAAAPDGRQQDVLVLTDSMLVPDAPPSRGMHERVLDTAAPADFAEPQRLAETADAVMDIAPEPPPPPIAAAPVMLPVPKAEPAIEAELPFQPLETPPMSAALSALPPGLTSPETEAAAAGSVSSLIRALTSDRTAQVHNGGPTIADLVREEIRPVLKTWLDTNLPPMVERMVRAEIERVIARAAV